MRIAFVHARTVRWSIAATGSARGRTRRESIIIEVVTSDGHRGEGEAAPLDGTLAEARVAIDDLIARVPFDLDDSPAAISQLAAELAPSSAAARFAIEAALLAARTEKGSDPITGQNRTGRTEMGSDPVRDSAVVVDTPDEARAALDGGAKVLKVKVGPEGDLERVLAIHRAAPLWPLRLDANRTWPRERVRERLFALAELPIEYIEEPCVDAHDFAGGPVPIALDESLAEYAPAELAGLGALVLKPTLLGIGRCLELAARARAAGVAVVVTHALEGPVGYRACIEVARSVGGGPHGLAPHPALAQARVVVATPEPETVEIIRRALDAGIPIALLHHKLAPDELARQKRAVEDAVLPADAAAILFTSGSTGVARGVVLPRSALDAAAAAHAAHLGWRPGDRWLLALSTAHAGGLAVIVRCRAAGVPIELATDEGDLAAAIARCTLASLVPTQLARLLDDPAWRSPPSLRAVLLGGAAAPLALLEEAARRGVPFLTTYGLTETFGQVATALPARAGDPTAPLVPLAGVEIRTIEGRIALRAPTLATAYLDGTPIAPELVTADIGGLVDGALRIAGRADDVIITGGENVHPAQVEAVLAQTPGVRAACAFGVPDARWGQLVGAAIAISAPFDIEAAARRWHEALPPHARPRVIATTASLPLLPGGKVDRRAAAALPARPVEY